MNIITKDFSYRGKHYTIVNDGKFYMTIDKQFIDEHGHTTKALNYSDGLHPARTLADCIQETKNDLDMQHYLNEGMTRAEAMATVLDSWDMIDELRRLFDK